MYTVNLRTGFSTSALLILVGWMFFFVRSCLAHCRMFSIIPRLHPLDAPSCDKWKGLQILLNVPWKMEGRGTGGSKIVPS